MTTRMIDPVCGMTVAPRRAAAHSVYKGKTVYFCAPACKQRFDADPEHYPNTGHAPQPMAVASLMLAPSKLQAESAGSPLEQVDLAITGMSCVACAHHIEQNLSAAAGVHRANVNFATARATVEYDPATTDVLHLVEAVKDAGYQASGIADTELAAEANSVSAAHEEEYTDARRKFWVAALLSLPVLVIAMSHGR